MIQLLWFVVLLVSVIAVPTPNPAKSEWSNVLKRTTLVLAPPSVWDATYAEKYDDILAFYVSYANMISASADNLILLVDKHTAPLFAGKVPDDVILEADLYNPFIRDYAPIAHKDPAVLFHYLSSFTDDEMFVDQVQNSILRFIDSNFIDVDETDLKLSGSNVIDNGVNRAIISQNLANTNLDLFQPWAVEIKLRNIFGNVAIIEPPTYSDIANENYTIPLDRIMSFISPDILIMAKLDDRDRLPILATLKRKFRDHVKILELPMSYEPEMWFNQYSTCGLYTTLLSTNQTVFMPAFGNDPENWKRGFSTITDRQYHQMIQVNTHKQVFSINMPYSVCQMGAGISSMTWKINGYLGDQVVQMARMKYKIKKMIQRKQDHYQNLKRKLRLL